jgi:hypothetical protein
MSGFFGIAREDGHPLEEKFLEKLAEELRHRGPDGTSVWTSGRVGGCFARMVTGPAKQTGGNRQYSANGACCGETCGSMAAQSCWRNLQPGIDGREVHALSLEDELVLNCIHGAKHFWERLTWVADVAALAVRHPEIDWKKARGWAKGVGAERMLRVGLQLGASVLDLKLPDAMEEGVERDEWR